jgi:nucleotide-binding universal stress UspA family protein
MVRNLHTKPSPTVCRWQKSVGAKVSALVIEESFNVHGLPASRTNLISSAFAEYAEHAKAHAEKELNSVAQQAKAAGVACETIQMTHDQPYQAIVATAKEKGCDLIVMASEQTKNFTASH